MAMRNDLLRLIEIKADCSIEQLQSATLEEHRHRAEKKYGWPMRLIRQFPFIGRGSVMGGNVATHQEIDRQLAKAIR